MLCDHLLESSHLGTTLNQWSDTDLWGFLCSWKVQRKTAFFSVFELDNKVPSVHEPERLGENKAHWILLVQAVYRKAALNEFLLWGRKTRGEDGEHIRTVLKQSHSNKCTFLYMDWNWTWGGIWGFYPILQFFHNGLQNLLGRLFCHLLGSG